MGFPPDGQEGPKPVDDLKTAPKGLGSRGEPRIETIKEVHQKRQKLSRMKLQKDFKQFKKKMSFEKQAINPTPN